MAVSDHQMVQAWNEVLQGRIEGVGEISLTIGPAE